MNGPEFVKQLAGVEHAKGVPVGMIAAEGTEGHGVRALSAGAGGCLRKLFTADPVEQHILPVLAGKA